MSTAAIRVQGVSKEYRLGHGGQGSYRTLRDALTRLVTIPFRAFRAGAGDARGAGERRLWALRDVSFEIAGGEVVGVIGRNGAGKSTLLKILSRITAPTRGRVEIRGRLGSLLEVGTGFHPELTGRENVYLNGAILGMRKAEIDRRFDEIVAFAEVEPFIDEPVKHYSSGMYVRLAFAVAAHLDPEILLVDEVLAVGDTAFQKKCLGKMGTVARQGRTVLFVSHDLGAIGSLCSTCIYLDAGQVRAMGRTGEVIARYLSELFDETVELDRLRLAGYGADVQFVAIKLVSEDGVHVPFGAPVAFSLALTAAVDVDRLSLGCSIYTRAGQCVGTVFTTTEFAVTAGQRVALRLTVSRPRLAPGAYFAGFSVGYGGRGTDRQDLDVVIGRPAFDVRAPGIREDGIAKWNPRWGAVVFEDAELATDG